MRCFKMDELAKRFSDMADKYGPDVVQAALSAARVEGISRLVDGVILFVAAVLFFLVALALWRKGGAVRASSSYSDEGEMWYGGAIFIGLIASVITGPAAAFLLSPWM